MRIPASGLVLLWAAHYDSPMRHYLKDYWADSRFRKTMMAIALPIILQMLLTNSLSLVDTMMIGRLGETEVAAVGLANQLFFLVFLIFFGLTSGTGIFIAQYWGKGDKAGIHRVMGLSLAGVLIFASVFAGLSFLIPEKLIRIFSPNDQDVIAVGARYLRIVAPSYFFSGISFAYGTALRSIGRPKLPLAATAVSMGLNSILNLILIFGLFGAPAMGVAGAAIATAVSRFVELLVVLTVVYKNRLPVAAGIRDYLDFDADLFKRFVITAGPVLLNEIAWGSGMSAYKAIFGRMGTDVVAAAGVTESIQGLFFVILIGTGNTAAVMVGNKIGEGDRDGAYLFARHFLVQSVLLGVLLGALMPLCGPLLIPLLKMDAGTIDLVRRSLLILGFLIPVKAFNIHLVVGVLRSGGDTGFAFLTEFIGVWGIGVPVAYFAGLYWWQPLPLVYLFVASEEVYKCIAFGLRFLSGKWIHDLTGKEDSA